MFIFKTFLASLVYYSLWVSLFILVSVRIVDRMWSAPLWRPHTGYNAICGTVHVRIVLWRRRKLKELSLLFNTPVWQFKIKNWSSTSQVIIIRVEMPKMVAGN